MESEYLPKEDLANQKRNNVKEAIREDLINRVEKLKKEKEQD